jgi:RNA polymerase sigma factor (sigma-70 family)
MAANTLPEVLRHLRRLCEAEPGRDLDDGELLERFLAHSEEAAFALLVQRHGPMVLGVCRRVLHDAHHAEDAFQATFLVLARRSAAIRQRGSLASWLYGVAQRIAREARARFAAQRKWERRSAQMPRSETLDELTWQELRTVLDEEVGSLPERYRAPVVLCYFEGKSYDEAARELGWPKSSLASRLARAREALRERLARRGLALSATALAAGLAERAAGAAVPALLILNTVKGATRFAAGKIAGSFSSQALALAEDSLKGVLGFKTKALLILLAVALAAGGAGFAAQQAPGEQPPPAPAEDARAPAAAPAKEITKPPAADEKDTIAYSGRVHGPDGRPVPDAKLYLTLAYGYFGSKPQPSRECGTTGPDGRFQFLAPRAKYWDQSTVVAAAAPNYGAGWVDVAADGKRVDLTIPLVADDVPITGQIVDLEGKPVPGATVRVVQIEAAPGEHLGPWLEAVKAKKGPGLRLESEYLRRHTIALSPAVTTDAAGRFRLTGIGRDRLVRARLDGPTIASQLLCILTRPGRAFEATEHEGNPEYGEPRTVTTYYGADFRHAAAPCQQIVGVVRDKDTKQPLSAITIRSYAQAFNPSVSRALNVEVQTTTDALGHYRLTGMPKGKGYQIVAIPGSDQPYIVARADVPEGLGLDPVTVDIELRRGVWIEGKITDKVTGKPLKGSVEYFSLYSNPSLRDYPGFDGAIVRNLVAAQEDGSYRVVGLPGPGLVGVYYHKDPYLRAPERDDEFGIKERSLSTAPYHLHHPVNYSALARINPARGVDSVRRDVTLDPGWSCRVAVEGPDGKPLAGVRTFGLAGWWWDREGAKTAEFTLWFNPHRPHDILLQHPEKGLVGVGRPPKENGGAVTVRLEPGAAVTGRLVDADGQPRPGVELKVLFRPKAGAAERPYSPERIRTDREGRFRLDALLPGYEFRLSDETGGLPLADALRSGRTKDLGDVRLKASNR